MQAFSFTGWETFPSSSCCSIVLAGPQTDIAVMDALFPCSVFLRLEQMAGAEAIGFLALASWQCPGMLQPTAALGRSVFDSSNEAVRVGEHFVLGPMPKSHPF